MDSYTLYCIILYTVYDAIAVAVALRFLHMFQLSSYQFPGYWRWLKSEGRRIPLNLIPFYRAPRFSKHKAKKPFKLTSRALRIAFVLGLLIGGAVAASIMAAEAYGEAVRYITLAIGHVCIYIFIPLANLLLWPVQKSINHWYIRDARKRLWPGLTIIGVTGSYGKTSTKTYIAQLLSIKYNVLATPASYNTPMGVVRAIRENLEPSHSVFVCEMGARHIGDIKEVCKIARPGYGVLTAIGPQHLETFKSVENIAKTKFELIDALPDGGTAFLCWSNEYIRERAGTGPASAVRYAVSGDESLDIRAENLTAGSRGLSFDVVTKAGERERFTCGLLGRHTVENITAAIAVALHMGIPLRDMVPAVRCLKPAKHRLELLPKGGGLTIIDDAYNSNPAGAAAALEALSLFSGVKVIITPGMVELGEAEEAENRAFGERIAKVCDYAALVGERQAGHVLKGVLDAGYDEERVKVFPSFDGAYQWALTAGAGEKVILLENDLPDNYR